MKFKITYNRWGVLFSPVYRKSWKGALKAANAKGWATPDRLNQTKPTSANIEVKLDADHYGSYGDWQFLARVTADGIMDVREAKFMDMYKRIKQKMAHLEGLSAKIEAVEREARKAQESYEVSS